MVGDARKKRNLSLYLSARILLLCLYSYIGQARVFLFVFAGEDSASLFAFLLLGQDLLLLPLPPPFFFLSSQDSAFVCCFFIGQEMRLPDGAGIYGPGRSILDTLRSQVRAVPSLFSRDDALPPAHSSISHFADTFLPACVYISMTQVGYVLTGAHPVCRLSLLPLSLSLSCPYPVVYPVPLLPMLSLSCLCCPSPYPVSPPISTSPVLLSSS